MNTCKRNMLTTAVVAPVLSLGALASAAPIGVSVADNGATPSATLMASGDTAGPTIATPTLSRDDNWNNITLNATAPTGAQNNIAAGSVIDGTGAIVAGLSVTFTPGANGGGDGSGATNGTLGAATGDVRLYNGYYDSGANGVAAGSTSGTSTFTVSNIPASYTSGGYSLLVFMRDDGPDRAGAFTVGTTTLYARGKGQANQPFGSGTNAFTDYVLSTDSLLTDGVDQGNYVRFDNLTATTLTFTVAALNPGGLGANPVTGTTTTRNKVVGFQIVEAVTVPEPTTLSLAATAGSLLLRRRRTA